MRKILTLSGLIAVLFIALITVGDALTQITSAIQPSGNTTTLSVSNTCSEVSVTVAQLVWFDGSAPIKFELKIPPQSIPAGSTTEFLFENDATPTAVQVTGTVGGSAYTLTVEANGTARAECVTASLRTAGQPIPPTTTQPSDVPLPFEAQGLQGMTPAQAIQTLGLRGVPVEVKGTEAQPFVGGVASPIIVGALGAGVQAIGYFVSAAGQLRSSVLYDQPLAGVTLVVIGASFCASISPSFLGLGGLSVSCDRPVAMAPFTTIGGGPVPGFLFLVLLIKTSVPVLPYVLSLST